MNGDSLARLFAALRRDAALPANAAYPIRPLQAVRRIVADVAPPAALALRFDRSCGVLLSKAIELLVVDLVAHSYAQKCCEARDDVYSASALRGECDADDAAAAGDVLEARFLRSALQLPRFDYLSAAPAAPDDDELAGPAQQAARAPARARSALTAQRRRLQTRRRRRRRRVEKRCATSFSSTTRVATSAA